ncbi:MAG TPA: helix-turn-helix transcriptional regulator [Acidobacteriaceae bacterium]|jgi:AraC-like DNA-binding protein|nr:helix-turn-helix transcriptional regulator [Acidobacteriaceae bacterium]
MPSSTVRYASDPEEYVAAIRPAGVDLTVTQRGQFRAKTTRLDLHRLYVQRGQERLARVAHMQSSRVVVKFLVQPGPEMIWNGTAVEHGKVALHGPAQPQYHRLSGPTQWAGMSLDPGEFAEILPRQEEVAARGLSLIVTPHPAKMSRLCRLHAAAIRVAERKPHILTHPKAARGLEQALIHAMVDCVAAPDLQRSGQLRAVIISRFRELLKVNPDRPMYLEEIAAAIGVSSRALRYACHEYFGVSPVRYLMLRRMNLARRALREADAARTRVTDIAMEYGFWELGRFAVRYRSLFGESPSATLRQTA